MTSFQPGWVGLVNIILLLVGVIMFLAAVIHYLEKKRRSENEK